MAKPTDPSQADPTEPAKGVMQAQVRMMDAVLKQNIEALDFLKTRFEKDRAMLGELAAAPDATAAGAVLSGFWQRLASDYMQEAGRLSSLMQATAQEIGEGTQDEIRSALGRKTGK
ncbi:phasin family protein [Paragemmobacter straminiformis]|uniref:Phasin family protein n=1 Tax=Paragemmobacter straminiformis TaxID=2045119 RepID=A0A842I0Z0_9RHOB|nr:phasin family protein [Gemmobacter straminiformis]MBC2834162.1 phasin family protein [Gemmobacter straminiformis]